MVLPEKGYKQAAVKVAGEQRVELANDGDVTEVEFKGLKIIPYWNSRDNRPAVSIKAEDVVEV